MHLRVLFTALFSLVPAAFALWQSRGLLRRPDDPALSERRVASRSINAMVYAFSMAILVPVGEFHLVWALPLLILARMAVGYRVRKVLHGETWSFGAYLSFFGRLVVAVYGFWILLVVTPLLIARADPYSGFAAAGLAALLLAWNEFYVPVFCALLRTRCVDEPTLRGRFEAMVNTCRLPRVMLEQVELQGGVLANAIALPSTRWPAVVVSSTLFDRLDHGEVTAILGHELAHIEQFTSARLRWLRVSSYLLITASTIGAWTVLLTVPKAWWMLLLLWPLLFLAVMAARARGNQSRETASDLRAAALTGDGETLVRALIKVYGVARLPRRWAPEDERHATHPSLARRIQAIRSASGVLPPILSEPATFAGVDGSSSIAFHADRLVWNEQSTATHTFEYGDLVALHVDAKRARAPRLIAVDRAKRRWEFHLKSEDLGRAQATLDVVDARLAAAAPEPPVMPIAVARALAVVGVLAALSTDQITASFPGWLAVIAPAASMTAAAGAACISGAALIWRQSTNSVGGANAWSLTVLAVCGLALIAVSIANRHERMPRPASIGMSLLAAGTILVWSAALVNGFEAVALHRAASEWAALTTFPLALAGATAFAGRRWFAYAAAPLALLGLGTSFLGSTGFLDRFAHDPFLPLAVSTPSMTVLTRERSEFGVPYVVSAIRLSADGAFLALESEDEDEDTTIHAGRFGGFFTDFTADDAVFAGTAQLLVLERQRGTSVLRLIDLEHDGDEVWSVRVPINSARLAFDQIADQWRLLGWSSGELVSATGSLGSSDWHTDHWAAPIENTSYLRPLAVSDDVLLAVETRWRSPRFGRFGPWLNPLLLRAPVESRFWTIRHGDSAAFAMSRFDSNCRGEWEHIQRAICTAFDGTRTGFFALDARSPTPVPLGGAFARFYLRDDAGDGWVHGFLGHGAILIRTSTQQAIRVADDAGDLAGALAIAGTNVVASFENEHGSAIRLYTAH